MIFENADKMKFERIKEMPPIKREIINYLFTMLERKAQNKWWHYQGSFQYEGKEYNLECDCKMDNQLFTYKNLHIEHKQQVIDIEDMIKRGVLQ